MASTPGRSGPGQPRDGVALQLRAPAADLALEEAVGAAEVGQAGGTIVDAAERGDGVGHLQPHAVTERVVAHAAAASRRAG